MLAALVPANWLDWLILVYVGLGALAGLRRGFILSLVGLGAVVAATLAAIHWAPVGAAFAQRHWQLETKLAAFLGRVMPLPDGAGATPYSPYAAGVFAQQIGGSSSPAYAQAMGRLLTQGRAPSPPPATLGAYVADMAAQKLAPVLAFLVILIGGEVVLANLGVLAFSRTARHGWAGALNRVGGAALAGVERLAEAALVLSALAVLTRLPEFSGLAATLAHSHWSAFLLAAVRRVPGFRSWLAV